MGNMRDFDRWLNQLSDDDIDTILYEFYLCLKEEECVDGDGCGECPACKKANLQKNFHTESVLYGIDLELAQIGYEVLEKHFPSAITPEVRDTAIARGIIELKPVTKTARKNKKKRDRRKEKRDEQRLGRSSHWATGIRG